MAAILSTIASILLLLTGPIAFADTSSEGVWRDSIEPRPRSAVRPAIRPLRYRMLTLDWDVLEPLLAQAPARSARLPQESGNQLRTYRLALAATGEYTAFHCGTVEDAMAAIVAAMNRVNEIYEREVAIRMQIVANNDLAIYTDDSTDPYTNGSTAPPVSCAAVDIMLSPDADFSISNSPACGQDTVLSNQTITGVELFEDESSITAGTDLVVGVTGTLRLWSGGTVNLEPGFRVRAGGRFQAGLMSGLCL